MLFTYKANLVPNHFFHRHRRHLPGNGRTYGGPCSPVVLHNYTGNYMISLL